MKKTFYVTTPIYYSNGIPHIGHGYSSFIADILARYHRNLWEDVKFATGVDENSQKVVEKAKEAGEELMQYCDRMAEIHKSIWDGIDISYTDFVRTTSQHHKKFVQKVLQKSFDNGDIYLGEYEGLYCVGCEGFKKESDLTTDGLCPDHRKAPDRIKERNYFFRLSKYQKQLEEFYASHPDFVTPSNRYNEVLSFVKEGLEDFSVSRETNTFGISLPFDPNHVAYVWYDALFNYVSYCEGGDERFWPANVHVVGKDIIRFHAIFWPAMLISAGYPIPHQILTTGYFTVDGQKISKSLNNVISPVDFCEEFSRDMLVLYLLSAFPIGQDGDFSTEQAKFTYNAKLANNVWNLLNRFLVLSLKVGGNIDATIDSSIETARKSMLVSYNEAMIRFDLKSALEFVFEFGDVLNKFIDTEKPWEKNQDEQKEQIIAILYTLGEGLRTIALCLAPFFPVKMRELLERIGLTAQFEELTTGGFETLVDICSPFFVAEKGDPLYPRLQI